MTNDQFNDFDDDDATPTHADKLSEPRRLLSPDDIKAYYANMQLGHTVINPLAGEPNQSVNLALDQAANQALAEARDNSLGAVLSLDDPDDDDETSYSGEGRIVATSSLSNFADAMLPLMSKLTAAQWLKYGDTGRYDVVQSLEDLDDED